ncbi:ATP-dependent helicase BRM-like [Cucurbita maxima]|uniref:ATP-dependent helicase BRM-like n=1 Tax=Cucurbita maxima TaxID=3661 RepID=A0A6J1IXS2_CUCMA|nr:ATP-dependent helicase BRM-like [Cucurbita maxima]
MQSGGGGPLRNPGFPAGRAASTSAAASPSSSSSAVSTPHLGFDSMQQQLASRQSLQQQLLRKSDGNEALLSYQAGGLQGVLVGNNFPQSPGSSHLPQQARKFMDMAQQHHSSSQESQNRSQGLEQQAMNHPMHQAYLQYALAAQQKSAMAMQSQHQAKMGIMSPRSLKDQEMRIGNQKIQELIPAQVSNQASTSLSKNSADHFVRGEKQMEQGQPSTSDQRGDPKSSNQFPAMGNLMPVNMTRSMQAPQAQPGIPNMANNQLAMAQMQAMQAWALERNIDLSLPGNANLVSQILPLIQSRMVPHQKGNENNMGSQLSPASVSKQQTNSPFAGKEASAHANSLSDVSGQSSSTKARQIASTSPFGQNMNASVVNNTSHASMQQFSVPGMENQLPSRTPVSGNTIPPVHSSESSGNVNQSTERPLQGKTSLNSPENLQTQYVRQVNRSSPQTALPPSDAGPSSSTLPQGGHSNQTEQQKFGFTKHQLHVLKAQILAFRRLKKGEGTLPQELLRAIAPPPLDVQLQQQFLSPGGTSQDKPSGNIMEERGSGEVTEKDSLSLASSTGHRFPREEVSTGDEKSKMPTMDVQPMPLAMKETVPLGSSGNDEQQAAVSVKSDQEIDHGCQKPPAKSNFPVERGKAIANQAAVPDVTQAKKPAPPSTPPQSKDVGAARKYHGPLFDFPYFTRKHDSFGSAMAVNNNNNLTLAYDVKDLLFEEGLEVINKKRKENLKKIGGLLAVNLEQKRIRPDLVVRLQIEEKKLRLLDLQARLRDEIDQQQQEIMAMPDRPYRKFVRLCERQRMELTRQVQASQKAMREKQLKSVFLWRKKLLEAHWAIRDARTARNRGVAKYHERMMREFSKRKDDDRNRRMEALKNNDVERYREMLLEQQTSMPADAAERYSVLTSFLTQTEEYLHKLGNKITAAKSQQEVAEAAKIAAAAARLQGLSEEEVRSASACAGEEVMIRNRFMEMNAPRDSSYVNKYYNLAHAVNERIARQPSMLRAGTLRDYQLVGLQWMLSLYNNKLNGILADEMGLGKTVQVMALIAYLMEFKGNNGPHLIIVPNAVLVNWKSELHTWLPSVSCIYYVGGKDERSKLFSQEVCALKFNVLVTTYEFIMYDRSKLSKIDWKYIIIDEAQRMKDRESVLARDLDRYKCQRRLLLTGTPLQNDLKELWSLLNLLLPEVFDNRKAFHDWFSKPFQKEGPTQNVEDDWLETEKKIIIIHRLHQILEPFMLRRRVEDVEGSLPPKVSIVLRCRMSAFQSAIYDWIKSTGTLRVDPEDEKLRVQKNPNYQPKVYKTLNNRCMELRKTCNHPLLNYPYYGDLSKDFLVRSCGKLWILDRILIKLQKTGHRVLLFSTMTKLLDILEEYLQWRRLMYRRIDGTTSLEDRESAIVDFNSPDSVCFIFLLSIRAAGRGLNLQSADTVIIYDPDPNPKNEEQAVARAHRIGQTREVKVIYMEAVVDKISSHQKEDELRSGGSGDLEDDFAGKDRYMGSIESLIRNNIQQYKIDMADEVINAGRFDQRTTHEERRLTLETLLHDEERYQETVHDVPSLQEVNRMIARSEEEVELFDQMDEELDWTEEMTRYDQVPKWIRASTREVNTAIANLSKRPSKNILFGGGYGLESSELGSELSLRTERKRGRPKGKKIPNYKEMDDDNGEFSEESSDERNGYSVQEEEGEIAEFEDDEFSRGIEVTQLNQDQMEDGAVRDARYDYPRASDIARNNHLLEEAGSSGSSSSSRRLTQLMSPVSSQKFGFLSALDARPSSLSKRLPDELEEGEIAISGDSHMENQLSESWIHDREDGEEEQVLQPKIKRKRSLRLRPRPPAERREEKIYSETQSLQYGDSSSPSPFLADHKFTKFKNDPEAKPYGDSNSLKHEQNESSSKTRRNLSARKTGPTSKFHSSPKSSRLNSLTGSTEDAVEHNRESGDGKPLNVGGNSAFGSKMPDIIQRRCKNVISKLQSRIDKEGHQIVPLLTDLWKRIQNSSIPSGVSNNILDVRKIDQRIDRLEYNGVMELVFDVQFMLKGAMQFYGFSYEVRVEAKKVHDLFFDILKIAFPDTDFREARNALPFSSPGSSAAAASLRERPVSQTKRQKMINDMDADSGPPRKSLQRGPMSREETRATRGHLLAQKESRFGSGSGSKDQYETEEPPILTHPGELVICKKKRKDREKSIVRPRTASGGPVSPPSVARGIRSPGPGSVSKDSKQSHPSSHSQGWSNQPQSAKGGGGGGGGPVSWANPVKRLRTDSGKRRPSHI